MKTLRKPTERLCDLRAVTLAVTLAVTTEAFHYLHPLKDGAEALISGGAAANMADAGGVINIQAY